MKSKKKLLLLGVGAMSALALGVGATSTFAWYQSATATVSLAGVNSTGTMTTAAEATIDAISAKMKFTITLSNGLEPTSPSDGFIYVVSNSKAVKSATQTPAKQYHSDGAVTIAGLYYENGTDTLSPEDAKNLDGREFKLTITGGSANSDGQLRIASSLTEGNGTSAALNRVVNADTVIGYVTIHANGEDAPTYTYKNRSGTGEAFSTFFYAYTPVHTETAGSAATADEAGSMTLNVTASLSEESPS